MRALAAGAPITVALAKAMSRKSCAAGTTVLNLAHGPAGANTSKRAESRPVRARAARPSLTARFGLSASLLSRRFPDGPNACSRRLDPPPFSRRLRFLIGGHQCPQLTERPSCVSAPM